MHEVSPVMFFAIHDVSLACTREHAIRMQNASAIIDFGRENTQAERGSTYESAIWMQRPRAVVARGARA
jgi:hypothetical protein